MCYNIVGGGVMVQKYIDDCYVIGTALLYSDKFIRETVGQIKNNFTEQGIETELTSESIKQTVSEWKDFFEMTEDKDVVLTQGAKQNKGLLFMLFHGVLPGEMQEIVMNAVFNHRTQKVFKLKRN